MSESNLEEETTHQHTKRQQAKRGKGEVVFMEEMDYKMEVEDKAEEKKLVVLKKEEFTEQEIREAFKKKLRKYSGKVKPEDFQQLF